MKPRHRIKIMIRIAHHSMMAASALDDDLICSSISWSVSQSAHLAEMKGHKRFFNTSLSCDYSKTLFFKGEHLTVNSMKEGGLNGYSEGN